MSFNPITLCASLLFVVLGVGGAEALDADARVLHTQVEPVAGTQRCSGEMALSVDLSWTARPEPVSPDKQDVPVAIRRGTETHDAGTRFVSAVPKPVVPNETVNETPEGPFQLRLTGRYCLDPVRGFRFTGALQPIEDSLSFGRGITDTRLIVPGRHVSAVTFVAPDGQPPQIIVTITRLPLSRLLDAGRDTLPIELSGEATIRLIPGRSG